MSTTSHFNAFLQGWFQHKQTLVDELMISLQNDDVKDETADHLVERVLSHYNRYYEEKYRVANHNPFIFFSPPWLTSFGQAMLWISGFRPSTIFRLVEAAVWSDLTVEQRLRVNEESTETRKREKEVSEEMARVQESVAAPPLYSLMREDWRLINGEINELGEAGKVFTAKIKKVMKEADEVIGSTVLRVLEILSPMQRIKFLLATGQYVLQVRRWGLFLDSRVLSSG